MNTLFCLSDFLNDKKYYITIYDNEIYIYKYFDIKKLSDSQIILNMENFSLIIKGTNLKIKKMSKEEILIEGNVLNIGKIYE